MDELSAFNLYHRYQDFASLLIQKGFTLRCNGGIYQEITPGDKTLPILGEITNKRFLVVYDHPVKEKGERKMRSKLVKLARDFEVRE